MRRALFVSGVLLAVVVGACGGSAPRRSSTIVLPQRPASGPVVFQRDCSSCHSLIGNESLHRPGGDLLGYTLTRRQLLEQTRQMPVRRPLSGPELSAVVDYVAAMQKRARPAGTGGTGTGGAS
jgi:mono/diheme cytochrome c family protein